MKNKNSMRQHPVLTTDLFGNRFFARGLNDFENEFRGVEFRVPPANIQERAHEFLIELSVPGFSKEDFKVEIEDNTLSIISEKKDEDSEQGVEYFRREFSFNSFRRSFRLPENIEAEKIRAAYSNGMLTVFIPKISNEKHSEKKNIIVK